MLILQRLFIIAAHSSPAESNNNDDDDYLGDKSDDAYDDDYDEVEEKRKSSTPGTQQSEEPYKTQEYEEKSDIGKTLILKCLGEGFDDKTLYMWHNGSSIIAQGTTKVTHDPRVSFSKKDGYLTVRDVSSYDDGTFRCRAFAGKNDRFETVIHVKVNGPPRGIVIGHSQHRDSRVVNTQEDITGETLVYRAGETNLRFKCRVAKARPEAKIDWVHNGNTILESHHKDHDIKIEDEGLMIIKTLHARHVGEYQCEASNEFGTQKATFKIDVQCEFGI